ncbi:hypothetical protein BDW62DRAFT_86294 [Aspergillus aurantiobrunneus]
MACLKHPPDVPAGSCPVNQGDYIFSHLYDVAIASTKLSVLALYYRAFVSNTFRRAVLATAVFVVLWLLTMAVVLGFQCRPLQKFWNPDIEGDCFNLVAFTFFTNITNLAADIWIFILPLPVISRLRISTKKTSRPQSPVWGRVGNLCRQYCSSDRSRCTRVTRFYLFVEPSASSDCTSKYS